MAADTRDKRFSLIGLGSPVPSVFPDPDGTIGAADRAQYEFLYAGISLSALTVVTVLADVYLNPTPTANLYVNPTPTANVEGL